MSAREPHDGRVWISRCPVPTASNLALDAGTLDVAARAHGLRAGSLQEDAPAGLRRAHLDHRLPMLLREGGNVPALWARARGAGPRLVAVTWVDEYQAVVALPGGPGDAAGLAGARLGVPRDPGRAVDHHAAMALRGHESALATVGLTLADARPTDVLAAVDEPLPASSAAAGLPVQWRRDADALLRGVVDAIYVKGAPGLRVVEALGLHEVVSLGDHPDLRRRTNNGTPRTITVDRELAVDRELVADLLAALLRAADDALAYPARLHELVSRDAGSGPPDVAARAYGTPRLHPRLDATALEALERQAAFLHRHRVLRTRVSVDAWLDPEPLRIALTRTQTTRPRGAPVP